ncbi:MAG TPA: hypothetical protein ENK06_07850 [Gammaproteobacteria bacterium]|nr:hypothetical protein [Gammaproteobacteria bacterium]
MTDIIRQYRQQQETNQLKSKISAFIGDYRIGRLLNRSGIRKIRGVSPLKSFEVNLKFRTGLTFCKRIYLIFV